MMGFWQKYCLSALMLSGCLNSFLSYSHAFVTPQLRSISTSSISMHQTIPFPLISSADTWGNWAVLSGAASISPWLGEKTVVGRLLGPPVTAMALIFLAASVGILSPGGTSAAKSMQLLSLQLATPMILLGADFENGLQRCGPLFVTFLLASLATIIACSVGWFVAGQSLTSALGRDGLVLAAALLAKNVGGGINYVAVCQSLGASPIAVTAGLCVDNIFALIYFPITSALASRYPDVPDEKSRNESQKPAEKQSEISVQSMLTTCFLSAILLWIGQKAGGNTGALPVCTLLTVLLATTSLTRHFVQPIRPTANTLGTLCLYLFFATAGAPGLAVAESVRNSLIPLGVFLTCLYSVHGLVLWIVHCVFKRNDMFAPQRLLVASSSAIGGPATSVALAKAAKWRNLEVPGLLVGNVGYAMATFCGLGYYRLFL